MTERIQIKKKVGVPGRHEIFAFETIKHKCALFYFCLNIILHNSYII